MVARRKDKGMPGNGGQWTETPKRRPSPGTGQADDEDDRLMRRLQAVTDAVRHPGEPFRDGDPLRYEAFSDPGLPASPGNVRRAMRESGLRVDMFTAGPPAREEPVFVVHGHGGPAQRGLLALRLRSWLPHDPAEGVPARPWAHDWRGSWAVPGGGAAGTIRLDGLTSGDMAVFAAACADAGQPPLAVGEEPDLPHGVHAEWLDDDGRPCLLLGSHDRAKTALLPAGTPIEAVEALARRFTPEPPTEEEEERRRDEARRLGVEEERAYHDM